MNAAINLIARDKKNNRDKLSAIFVDEIGSYRIERMNPSDFGALVLKEQK
jgi:3-dehydroquinate synthetase